MPKLDVYDLTGKKVSAIELSDAVFGVAPHKQSMYDAIIMQQASLRQGTHKTKDRSEVRGGGRKPWRQKGTGRARQGSIRSPQWRGGGIVFGPTPRSYKKKINRKVYQLALKSMYSSKILDKDLIVVNAFELKEAKTKLAITAFNKLEAKKPLVITSETNEVVSRAIRNIPRAEILTYTSVSVLDLAKAETVIITEDAVKKIEEVLG